MTSFPLRVVQGQKNAEKARTQSKNADQTYLETVKNLEEARALWEREMELLCRVRESSLIILLLSHASLVCVILPLSFLLTAISGAGGTADFLPQTSDVDVLQHVLTDNRLRGPGL